MPPARTPAAPRGHSRIGKPLHPNVGIGEVYRQRLERLIGEMNASLAYWLIARWREAPPTAAVIAQDESWIGSLRRTMRELERRWQKKFDEAAPDLAKAFADGVARRTTANMQRMLEDGGLPVIDFRMSEPMRAIVQATVSENVGLIRSIAQEHLQAVNGVVMRSVTTGRDLETLSTELRDRFDVPKKRAALIARDQNNKTTAAITRVRAQESGITRAIWKHSHGGKVPRPEHQRWDGEEYDVSTGKWSEVDQAWVWPGTPISCRCYSRPIIPGF